MPYTPPVVSASGTVLATKVYTPASDQSTPTTSSTSFADADATNMAITFTVPASGNVIIRASAPFGPNGNANGLMNLRLASADVTASARYVAGGNFTLNASNYECVLTGLTPGASVTYKLGIRTDNGAVAARFLLGPTFGTFVMSAIAV